MTVEVISVGTELLLGNIVNTNAQYLAEKCAMIGLSMYYQSTVGDNEERLSRAIQTAINQSDIIILTGGLGPTTDDLTKEVVAKVVGKELVEDNHTKAQLEKWFQSRGTEKIPENNWKQAMIIEGCKVLDNSNGTAPGLIVETEQNKIIILLPGPPNEMIPLFEEYVYSYLNKLTPDIIYSKTIKICGLGESYVETQILDLIENQTNPTIAPYAKNCEVHLRITAKSKSQEEADVLIRPIEKEIIKRFGINVYTTDEKETMEDVLYKLLKQHNLNIATAESCTGGLLAGRIINVAGISDVFNSGVISYSNKQKRKLLGVNKDTLKTYGAVSKKVAKEMAIGAATQLEADVAISTTGIAGPEGDIEDKPVGLVYIGCYVKGNVSVKKSNFNGDRQKNREYTVMTALDFTRRNIIEYYQEHKSV